MKSFFIGIVLLYLLTASGNLISQEALEVNDNVKIAIDSMAPQYKTIGQQIVPIPEGFIDYYKLQSETTDKDLKFLVIQDQYVVGVLQQVNGIDQILIDANGDGSLDYESQFLAIPYWVVAQKYHHNSSAANNVEELLNQLVESFNSDQNPYLSGTHKKLTEDLLEFSSNESKPNRDLTYALYSYYTLGNQYPWAALQAINYLAKEYYGRYEADHPIFYLHILESLINLSYSDEAIKLADSLVEGWPDFVPGRVYQWQLETDKEKKKTLYKELKELFSEHWIVKQI